MSLFDSVLNSGIYSKFYTTLILCYPRIFRKLLFGTLTNNSNSINIGSNLTSEMIPSLLNVHRKVTINYPDKFDIKHNESTMLCNHMNKNVYTLWNIDFNKINLSHVSVKVLLDNEKILHNSFSFDVVNKKLFTNFSIY
jgi:hypothetical protein